jgi:orotate phosphoribosyltransferase
VLTGNILVINAGLMKSDKQQLIDYLNTFSIKEGDNFTLASGKVSNIYVDVKKAAQNQIAYKLLAKLLSDKITQQFGDIDAVAGVVLGGCHLASIVSMQHPTNLNVVFVRNEAKDHGTKNLIERPAMRLNEKIVLLEDVLTTGNSAIKAAKLLQQYESDQNKFEVKGILTVVDRRENKTEYLDGFKIASLVNFEELN